MHCGNFDMFASFLSIGTITSSTRAQKCSRELGWMSPQVMWLRRSFTFLARGKASLLTKKTPLFLRGLGQSVCICSCPPMFCEMINTCGRSDTKNRGVR